MKENFETWKDSNEENLLFSRVVKAGKRVYYVDVKRDRYDEFYIAMTESKRIKEGTETERPQFEKHKIFLYREDILKFLAALTDAAQYVGDHRSLVPHSPASNDKHPTSSTDFSSSTTLDAAFQTEF